MQKSPDSGSSLYSTASINRKHDAQLINKRGSHIENDGT
jgi:hypothetical protein